MNNITLLNNFYTNGWEIFKTNSSIHDINTRPDANPSCFQKSTTYTGIKTFNSYHIALQSSRMAWQNSKQPSKNT